MKNIPKFVYLFSVIAYLYPTRMITLFIIVLPIYWPYLGSATHLTNLRYDPIDEMLLTLPTYVMTP